MTALIKYSRARIPRFVTVEWVEESWREKTLLDEEGKLIRCPMQSSFQSSLTTRNRRFRTTLKSCHMIVQREQAS